MPRRIDINKLKWKYEGIQNEIRYKDFKKIYSPRGYFYFKKNIEKGKIINTKKFKKAKNKIYYLFKKQVKDTLYITHYEQSQVVIAQIKNNNYIKNKLKPNEILFAKISKNSQKKINNLIKFYMKQDPKVYINKIKIIGELSHYLKD